MKQPSMRFDQDGFILPTDTHVVDPSEVRRLAGQSAAILARLQAGPATARELCDLSVNYRARLHDLRKAGYRIPAPVEDLASGFSVYRLEAA